MKDDPNAGDVLKKNQGYDHFLKVKIGSDNYANRLS